MKNLTYGELKEFNRMGNAKFETVAKDVVIKEKKMLQLRFLVQGCECEMTEEGKEKVKGMVVAFVEGSAENYREAAMLDASDTVKVIESKAVNAGHGVLNVSLEVESPVGTMISNDVEERYNMMEDMLENFGKKPGVAARRICKVLACA